MGCPKGCPNEIFALMCALWQTNPEDRPTFSDAFQILDSQWKEHNQETNQIQVATNSSKPHDIMYF